MVDSSSADPNSGEPEARRAEEMVDRMGMAVGGFVTRLGHQVLKQVALAREEAEDIWAEAQNMSRREGDRA